MLYMLLEFFALFVATKIILIIDLPTLCNLILKLDVEWIILKQLTLPRLYLYLLWSEDITRERNVVSWIVSRF